MIFEISYDTGRTVGHEQILVADELSESEQRTVGVPLERRETLGEPMRILEARRRARRSEDLISKEPTRHGVRVEREGRSYRDG
jgi:hypothetical protein